MAKKIAQKEIKKLDEKLKEKGIKLTARKEAVELIAEKGLSAEYGAREILRYIDVNLKRKLVDFVLFENKRAGASVSVSVKNGELLIKCR